MNRLHNVFQKLCPHKWCTNALNWLKDDLEDNFLERTVSFRQWETKPYLSLDFQASNLSLETLDRVSGPTEIEALHMGQEAVLTLLQRNHP